MRKVELTVFDEVLGRSWESLYFEVGLELSSGGRPDKAKVKIFNLSEQSKAFISKGKTFQIKVNGLLIYRGDLSGAKMQDHETEIKGGRGRSVRNQVLSVSWDRGEGRKDCLARLLDKFGERLDNAPDLGKLQSPFCERGKLHALISKLLPGEQWTFGLNGLVVGESSQTAVVIGPTSGLVGEALRTKRGVEMTTTLFPQVRPLGLVMVESKNFEGLAKVRGVEHEFSSNGLIWRSKIEADRI